MVPARLQFHWPKFFSFNLVCDFVVVLIFKNFILCLCVCELGILVFVFFLSGGLGVFLEKGNFCWLREKRCK